MNLKNKNLKYIRICGRIHDVTVVLLSFRGGICMCMYVGSCCASETAFDLTKLPLLLLIVNLRSRGKLVIRRGRSLDMLAGKDWPRRRRTAALVFSCLRSKGSNRVLRCPCYVLERGFKTDKLLLLPNFLSVLSILGLMLKVRDIIFPF